MEKYLNKISQGSFWLALFIELTIVVVEKSEYIIQYEGLWFRLTFVLFGISLVTTRHSLKEWAGLCFFALMGVISYSVTGKNEILRFVVFIWACLGKEMKKVLKFTFLYTLAGCLILALLSILGIYGEMLQIAVYRQGIQETRYCFGMGHPNALHSMVLALTLLGIYVYHNRLKWYGYAGILILHCAVFLLTKSRAGFMVSVGALLLMMILQYWKGIQAKKWPYVLGIFIIIGAVILSVLFAVYSIDLPLFKALDTVLTGRIIALKDSNNWEGMIHTWSLWSAERNNYYFDLGIVRVFYWYGIIPGITYFLTQCRLIWCGWQKKDYMLLAVLVAITIYSVFEAHYVSDYLGRNYIFFFFGLYLADMLGEKREEKKEIVNGS